MSHTTVSKSKPSWVGIVSYIIAALFLLYEMAVQVSPSIMVPQLMSELHISVASLGFMASAYFWSYTLMQIPVGLLFDRFPAKNLLIVAILLACLGIFFFSTAHHVFFLGLGRFLMGFGSAFAFVGVLMVAARWFSRAHFALLVGVAQLLAAVGAASGEGPLSLLVNATGWRHAALVLAIVGFALCVMVFFFMRKHDSEQTKSERWNFSAIWQSLRKVLGNTQMWWIAAYAFFSWTPIAVFTAMWGVPYLMHRFHISNTDGSWICAMTWAFLALTSPIIGYLSRRYSVLLLMAVTALVGALGAFTMLYWPNLSIVGAYIAAAGIGVGAAGQILTFELARRQRLKKDLGFSISFINMGVVAGGAIMQPLAALFLHRHASAVSAVSEKVQLHVPDFQYALLLVPLSFMVCFFLSTFVIKKQEL